VVTPNAIAGSGPRPRVSASDVPTTLYSARPAASKTRTSLASRWSGPWKKNVSTAAANATTM
jgi:hypothetical protein